jgi:hypothetical protein
MKKVLLFTLTLFLIVTMIGCPATVNIPPTYVRLTPDAEEDFVSMRSLELDEYNSDKLAFETAEADKLSQDENYQVQEWNPFEYYGKQYIVYAHPEGTVLEPAEVVEYLIEQTGFRAIDYKQDYVEIGGDRDYYDLSEDILLTSFYEIWLDGDDANFDGVVDEEDEPYYGSYMTDEDGNYVHTGNRMRRKEVGAVTEVSFYVEDNEGLPMTIRGLIIIVESDE